MIMVGMRGFEPPTTCTPSRCATRLRHIPTNARLNSFLITPVEESQYFPELVADLADRDLALVVAAVAVRRVRGIRGRARRRLDPARHLHLEPLLRPRDREALLVEELLDAQHGLDVAAPVDPLARAVLRGRQRRELRLPVAEDVGLGVEDLANLSDLGEELVRDGFLHRRSARWFIRPRRERRRAWTGGTRRSCGA